jgi:hypothetical protein
MTDVSAALAGRTPLGSDLKAGVDNISSNQEITFTLYRKVVLPLDGFVFWVKAQALAPSALFNAMLLDGVPFNQPQTLEGTATELKIMGSLHYATDQRQEEDATYAANRVVFTAEDPVVDFNQMSQNELYIATFDGIRFAFSARGSYYQQAELHHYVGFAVYSFMGSQVVDDPRLLNTRQLVVSNSLPAWLALNTYAPVYPVPLPKPLFPLYPGFLSPSNFTPPYGTVNIDQETTEGLAAAPMLSRTMSHDQLTRERVTVTLYGVNNAVALNFLDSVLQYSLDTAAFGITNVPIVLDDKRIQNELGTLAMKKRIQFDVNYYQSTVRNIARQLIEDATVTVIPGDEPFADVPLTTIA